VTIEVTAAPERPLTADARLEYAREHDVRHLEGATTGVVMATAFAVLAIGALFLPEHTPLSVTALVVSLLAYAVARSIEVEYAGTFVVVPTEAVFVVMWFVLPVHVLPLAVCGGALLGALPKVVRREVAPDRALVVNTASCWYAVGPALVLYLADVHAPRWQDVPVYGAALGGQFVLDFLTTFLLTRAAVGPVPLRTHLEDVRGAYQFDALLAPLGILAAFPAHAHPWAMLLLLPVLRPLTQLAAERREKNTKMLELSTAYRQTALLLGDVIEAEDEYTGTHSRDVVELVRAVARRLGLDGDEQNVAEFTALLHDVGKVKIPAEIINKPGPLDPDERELMNSHTILGHEMLEPIGGLLGRVGRIVRSCHEHWDGNGYPDGLAGEEIPLVARIVCACDAWSAMTTDRSYRPALSRREAAAELRRCAGTQFDPRVVDALAAELAL